MTWDDYSAMMAERGVPVYATKVGGQGTYEGRTVTWPTVYPTRQDTPEMRLDWVMKREVYPQLRDWTDEYKRRLIWLDRWSRSALFLSMLGDITRRLIGEGYGVVEMEEAGRGHWLEVTKP